MLLFIAMHAPLAVVAARVPLIANLYGFIGIAVILLIALRSREPFTLVCAVTYLASAELLWRMTGFQGFWETGKYLTALTLGYGILKMGNRTGSRPILPMAYMALLLCSVPLVFSKLPFDEFRNALSFNLSGPLALAVAAIFFSSKTTITREQLVKLWGAFIGPVIGISTIVLLTLHKYHSEAYADYDESSHMAAGGYGPNQVSALFGYAALLGLLVTLVAYKYKGDGKRRWLPALVGLFLACQSALTMSRGGLYAAGLALLVATVFLVQDRQTRFLLLAGAGLVYLAAVFVAIPWMDRYSGGHLSRRFSGTNPSGRDAIVQSEMEMWRENFVLGVGPGGGKYFREERYGISVASHTEYSRLLGEHGLLGLTAFALLMIMGLRGLFRTANPAERGVKIAFLVWTVAFMMGSAMRLVLPSFVFGLAMAGYDFSRTNAPVPPPRRAPPPPARGAPVAGIYRTSDER